MGLKSPTLEGLGILGTKAMIVEFALVNSFPYLKKDLMADVTSCPTIDQDFLKKPALYPSGPGALFEFKDRKDPLISMSVTSEIIARL